MEIIENIARNHKYISIDSYYSPKDVLLFDIETTGFTAENTTLYLIGCCFYRNGKYVIKQLFNDDGQSEGEILDEFFNILKNYKYLMHYNGDGFDIPYLNKKCEQLGKKYSFDNIESVDLYKKIKGYKDLFNVDNLKQKTIEKFIGVSRLDKYSGGDLIKIYQDYLVTKHKSKHQFLIQHNYEDLEGLLYCSCLLSYSKLKAGCFKVAKMSVREKNLIFSLDLEYSVPKRVSAAIGNIMFTANSNEATLSVPIISGEYKFFFDNYKEYYYLPAEDMAVHKSVATYVDRNYREPAKKTNCYARKQGLFISQIDSGIMFGYKSDYKSKETYIELVDSFLKDPDLLNSYSRYIVGKIL